MTKPLSALNRKLLAAAMNAGRASEGEGPVDENENEAEDTEEEEETPPASKKSGKSKAKAKGKATDDEETDAEGEDDDTDAEGDDEDTEAEGDDEDTESEGDEEEVDAEDEEEEPPASKKKATGERGRIQAILTSPLAAGREDLAQHLAFGTSSSPKAAFAILKAAPKAGKAASMRSRMAAEGNPNIKQGSGKGAASETDLVKGAIATAKAYGF